MNKRILEILENDDRITPAQISALLSIPEDEVIAQIKEMEESKVIVKYHALVNWEKVDSDIVQALIDVRVAPQREVGFDSVAERIYRFPEVRAVYLMSGAYDLSVLVEGKNIKEVAHFVSTKLATLDQVQGTATHFILKKYKQEGVILDDKEYAKRLAVTP